MFGNVPLCTHFIHTGLFDEYRLAILPVILGSGNLLFKNTQHRRLTLLELRPLSFGCVSLRYEVDRLQGNALPQAAA